MPKPDNDGRRKGGDNQRDEERMFKNLSEAVCALTCELFEHRKLWLANLATKQDLQDSEGRIIKAFGERVDPAAVRELSGATDKLEQAVTENK